MIPTFEDIIVVPGEIVKDVDLEKASVENKMILGPGLKRFGDHVVVSRGGVLRKKKNNMSVDFPQRRYFPTKGENVVGVVVKKIGDYFKVDICSSEHASLYFLSFENATKKYRPNLNPGDVIYAKLVAACANMESEVVCCDSAGRSGGLGVLAGDGMLITCSLHLARKLLNKKCKLLQCLGNMFKFENCVGMNGKIWIRGTDIDKTLKIADAILSAENVSLDVMDNYCQKLLHEFKR